MADNETKIKIAVEAPGASQALKQVQGGLDGINNSLGNVIAGAVRSAKFLTAAGVAGATAFGAKAVKDTADYADELLKASQRAGTTVEALSGLRHAADLSDVSFDDLLTGLGKLAKSSEDFRDGVKGAIDSYAKLKIDPSKFTDTAKLFEVVAEQISRMPDGAQKTAIAMEIFGKSGAKLIPLLNSGAEGIRQAREEAEQLGIVMSTETAQAAEEFNDNLTRLGVIAEGLKFQVGKNLLPALQDIVKATTDAAKEGGILNGIWVGLGATMAHILGLDQMSKFKQELDDINKKIEIVGKQLASGSLNPKGASDRLFGFLVPDVSLTEEAKARLRQSLSELQKERDSLIAAMKPTEDADKNRVNTMVGQSEISATAKEKEAARIKSALESQKDALADAERAFEAAKKKRAADLKEFQDLQKQLAAPPAGTQAQPILGYQIESAVDAARKARDLALNAPASQSNQLAQDALDKARTAGELLKQYKTQQENTGSSLDAASADLVVKRLGADLLDIANQASGVQEKLAQGQVASMQQVIQDTLKQAEALKKLTIDFDTDSATKSLSALMENLRTSISKNPIIVPVIAVKAADAANFTGVTDSHGNPVFHEPPAYAQGGLIQGPGSDTSDNLLAWLSPGEYIIRAAAVRKYGLERLSAINGMHLPQYANGGVVERIASRRLNPTAVANNQPLQPINITLPSVGTYKLQAEQDVAKIMQREFRRAALMHGSRSR